MGEFFDPADRVRIGKLRFKYDPGLQISCEAALPGDPELCRKIRVDPGNRADPVIRISRSRFFH